KPLHLLVSWRVQYAKKGTCHERQAPATRWRTLARRSPGPAQRGDRAAPVGGALAALPVSLERRREDAAGVLGGARRRLGAAAAQRGGRAALGARGDPARRARRRRVPLARFELECARERSDPDVVLCAGGGAARSALPGRARAQARAEVVPAGGARRAGRAAGG